MKSIIEKFYTSFSHFDAEAMVSCYHKEVIFEDPAFGILKGEHAKNMWRMLCNALDKTNDKITFSDVEFEAEKGNAKWEAHYTFSQTKRRVHNKISASFEFKDDLIIKHTDEFNLHRWANQALGFKGFLFGGTNFFKNKLHAQTNKLLKKFEDNLNNG